MEIVDLFYNIARENKRINSFIYSKAYEQGAGGNVYPLIRLDDPLFGQTSGQGEALKSIRQTANVDILGIPKDDADVINVQGAAFLVGLSVAERIKAQRTLTGYTVEAFSYISLRDYYDDNAAGWRFTFTLSRVNPVNKCADDYDPTKQFTDLKPLADFSTAAPTGCAVFANKPGLPDFSVSG